MKPFDGPVSSGYDLFLGQPTEGRLAALERLIVYARDEAEKLKADVLVFCLDASLTVARTELGSHKAGTKRAARTSRSKLPH